MQSAAKHIMQQIFADLLGQQTIHNLQACTGVEDQEVRGEGCCWGEYCLCFATGESKVYKILPCHRAYEVVKIPTALKRPLTEAAAAEHLKLCFIKRWEVDGIGVSNP